MRRLIPAVLAFFTLLGGMAFADSTTSRMGLVKPTIGSTNWGPKTNNNWDIVDSSAAALNKSNVFTSTMTVPKIIFSEDGTFLTSTSTLGGGGMIVGSEVSGASTGTILWTDADGNLASDNDLNYSTSTKNMSIGGPPVLFPPARLSIRTDGANYNASYVSSNWDGSTTGDVLFFFADSGEAGIASSHEGILNSGPTLQFKPDQELSLVGKLGIDRTGITENIEIGGGILIGQASGTGDGTIEYDGGDFLGRKAGSWVSLTGGGMAIDEPVSGATSGSLLFISTSSTDLIEDNEFARYGRRNDLPQFRSFLLGVSTTAQAAYEGYAPLILGAGGAADMILLSPTEAGVGQITMTDAASGLYIGASTMSFVTTSGDIYMNSPVIMGSGASFGNDYSSPGTKLNVQDGYLELGVTGGGINNGIVFGELDAITKVLQPRAANGNFPGGLMTNALANPSISYSPAIDCVGTSEYAYKITEISATGETLSSDFGPLVVPSAQDDLTTCPLRISFFAGVSKSIGFNIYRTSSTGTPSTLGYIGTIYKQPDGSLQYDDAGVAGNGIFPSEINNTGKLTVGSTIPWNTADIGGGVAIGADYVGGAVTAPVNGLAVQNGIANGGFIVNGSSAIVIPDNATPAVTSDYTFSSFDKKNYWFDCQDADGCELLFTEAGVVDGTELLIMNTGGANFLVINDSAGLVFIGGGESLDSHDSASFTYAIDEWVATNLQSF